MSPHLYLTGSRNSRPVAGSVARTCRAQRVSVTATCGCACPRVTDHSPDPYSTYSFPSTSHECEAAPRDDDGAVFRVPVRPLEVVVGSPGTSPARLRMAADEPEKIADHVPIIRNRSPWVVGEFQ